MSGANHIVGGIVFTGLYLSMWDKNIYKEPHFLFFTAFFALLPDIDHTRSLIGKTFYPIAKWLDKKFGHRTITHSLLCYFVLATIVAAIENIWFQGSDITKIFLWAYASHLIFDMLTLQGIPLFYPFKKNPCVMPGNPKFRLKSSDFRTESIVFLVFIALAFTTKDLFAKGFWNTYNSAFGTVKHLHNEQLQTERAIRVNYDVIQNNKNLKGNGYLVNSTADKAIIFSDRFITINSTDKIIKLNPVRTDKQIKTAEFSFSSISFDSLQSLIKNKPIITLKIQSTLPISYAKDNKPQSSTSFELDYVYNPVLKSNDIDSLDISTQKEIELTKIEIEREKQQLSLFNSRKKTLLSKLAKTEADLQSKDLAIKEKAIREYPNLKSQISNLSQPVSALRPLQIKLNFLNRNLRIKKNNSVNGFISYYTIN